MCGFCNLDLGFLQGSDRGLLPGHVRSYAFLRQIVPHADPDLEMLNMHSDDSELIAGAKRAP